LKSADIYSKRQNDSSLERHDVIRCFVESSFTQTRTYVIDYRTIMSIIHLGYSLRSLFLVVLVQVSGVFFVVVVHSST
jgi:hypothetical protein